MKAALCAIALCLCFSSKAQTDSNQIGFNHNSSFRLYPTENIYTFLKLDTRNGRIWQVQWSTDVNRFESYLNLASLTTEEEEMKGRFMLYPTQNMWTFILLDQIDGRTWQVQWNTDYESRGILPISD